MVAIIDQLPDHKKDIYNCRNNHKYYLEKKKFPYLTRRVYDVIKKHESYIEIRVIPVVPLREEFNPFELQIAWRYIRDRRKHCDRDCY